MGVEETSTMPVSICSMVLGIFPGRCGKLPVSKAYGRRRRDKMGGDPGEMISSYEMD